METQTKDLIQTETKNLNEIKDLKIVELKTQDAEHEDFYFLEENLTELLKDTLNTKKYKYEDLKVFYSLSYCQGDGFSFIGNITTKNAVFRIEKSTHHYNHERTTSIYLTEFKTPKGFICYEDLTEKQQKKADETEQLFKEEYYKICKDLEKEGYNIIEEMQKETILRQGFNRFLKENDISTDKEIFDFEYSSEEKKGFIKIADKGDTIFSLWIKPFKIETKKFIVTYKPERINETRIL